MNGLLSTIEEWLCHGQEEEREWVMSLQVGFSL
jgi:hypothetical protein